MKKIELYKYYDNEIDKNKLLRNLIINIVNKIKKLNYTFLENSILPLDSYKGFTNQFYTNLYTTEKDSFSKSDLDNLRTQIRLIDLVGDGRVTIFDASPAGCPANFTVAFPGPGAGHDPEGCNAQPAQWRHAWALSGGRGLSRDASIIGALGEAAECMSVWSRGDREDLIVNPAHHPTEPSILNAARFLKLSQRQIEALQATNAQFDPTTLSDPPSPHRLQLTNFSNRFLQYQDKNTNHVHFVPSLCGLIDEERFYGITSERLTSTNGSAVADTFDTASDKAVFELIERDAVSIWWYNRIMRDRVPDGLVKTGCGDDLFKWLEDRERQFHLIDISSDLGVPVVAALSYEPDGTMIADGYAAGRGWPEAVFSAVLEMLQAEISLSFMQQKADTDAKQNPMAPKSSFFEETLRMNLFSEPFMVARQQTRPVPASDTEVEAPEVLANLARNNVQVLVADLTRPELGIPAARAVSPQLRDWQPRFGPGRLYEVPVAMNWLDRPNTEASLNPRAFLS